MPAPDPTHRATIALVEDDPSLLAALSFALEADGYDVLAYTRAAPMLAASLTFDCMVVDFRLPDIDGLSLIARLRDRGVLSPAILITTHPDQRCRESSAALGVEIIEKPLMDSQLRRRIERLTSAN
jgi:FixJ family two-component response regulator